MKEEAARVGMHPRLWQKVERGETNATLETLARLGQALEVDPVVLLGKPPDGNGRLASAQVTPK